ncbi:MAG: hypothetical protein J7521_20955 [Caulobacter sp.]|nr:hypothetical protein [Caulobacter sp.]
MRRFLASFLALIALASAALIGAPASAQLLPTVKPWPALTSSNDYAFACEGLRLSYTSDGSAAPGNRYRTNQVSCITPNWTPTAGTYRLGWPAIITGSGAAAERKLTTPVRFAAAVSLSYDFSGTVYPVTFGCATCYSIVVQPGDWAIGDVPGFAPPANTQVFIRTYRPMQVGDNSLTGSFCNLAGSDMNEGGVNSSTPQNLLVQGSGAITAMQSNSLCYGPAFAVAKGWDGSPVALINGTSRLYGTNLFDRTLAARGALTAIERGLSSAVGGRITYGNLSLPGMCALYTSSSIGQAWGIRNAGLRAASPNVPYTIEISDLPSDPNGVNGGTCGDGSLATTKALALDHLNYEHNKCPTCRHYMVFGEPWGGTPLNNTYGSTLADQVPAATISTQYAVNAALKDPSWLPSWAIPLDLSSAYQDATDPTRWKVPSPALVGTTTASCASAQRTCAVSVNFAPSRGDNIVIEPGQANSETAILDNVTGTLPNLTFHFGGTLAKSHSSGVAVTSSYTRDQVHEGDTLAKAGGLLIEAYKVNGTIH